MPRDTYLLAVGPESGSLVVDLPSADAMQIDPIIAQGRAHDLRIVGCAMGNSECQSARWLLLYSQNLGREVSADTCGAPGPRTRP